MVETGHFATLWRGMAQRLGLEVDFVPGDWRHGVNPQEVERRLKEDRTQNVRAVMVVHNETSTGVTSRVHEVRRAIDRAGHPALLMVDTISSLASIDYRHDEWGVDVTVGGSQKGLMLPPGLGLQRAVGQGPRCQPQRSHAAELLGLARDAQAELEWILPLYACHQPPVRTPRIPPDAARGGAASGVSHAIRVLPKRRVPQCEVGVWNSCRSTRPSTRAP